LPIIISDPKYHPQSFGKNLANVVGTIIGATPSMYREFYEHAIWFDTRCITFHTWAFVTTIAIPSRGI
jgi:hypothetical protein